MTQRNVDTTYVVGLFYWPFLQTKQGNTQPLTGRSAIWFPLDLRMYWSMIWKAMFLLVWALMENLPITSMQANWFPRETGHIAKSHEFIYTLYLC